MLYYEHFISVKIQMTLQTIFNFTSPKQYLFISGDFSRNQIQEI
ncbi:hypothetical protein pb186bvf_013475 [Paramecium bursaria]